jgi:hypothetical protein
MPSNRIGSTVAIVLVALAAWTGLSTQFYVTYTHPNLADVSPFERGVRFFEYFTILTILLVAASLTLTLVFSRTSIGRFFSRISVMTAVAVYIALVGIVYNLVLQGLHEFEGTAYVADVITHDLVPLLYFGYWVFFVPKGELTWKMPFAWIIYPLVYVPYVLIRGASTNRYPYPFLDVGDLGYASVIVNTIVLTGVFLLLGEVFVAVDTTIASFRKKQAVTE